MNNSHPPDIVSRPADARGGLVVTGFGVLLLVALNMAVDPKAMDVSLVPRLLILQVILFFAVAAFFSSNRAPLADYRILRSPAVICFALYAGWTALSLLQAVNVSAGWTDVFRTFAAFCVLGLGCLVLPTLPHWPHWLARLGVVASLLAVGAGVYDYCQLPARATFRREDMEQVLGLMSNVNLYASFLLLLLPLCLAGVAISRGAWRWAAVVAGLLSLVAIGLLQTRAVYLGTGVFFFVTLGVALMFRAQFGLPAQSKWLAAAALLIVGASVFLFAVSQESNPVAERLRSLLSERSKYAAGGRPIIWMTALEMARDHPLTGVGAGNFPVRLHDYFDVEDPEVAEVHPNFLQPHNDFLWVLAEKGLPGLILFTALFLFSVTGLLGALRRGLSPPASWMALAALGALAGYATVSLFDFPLERINHQVYLVVYLSIAVVLSRDGSGNSLSRQTVSPAGLRTAKAVATLVLLVLAAGIAYSTAALRQERFVLVARQALGEGDWPSVVENARRARTSWKDLDPWATPVVFIEGVGLMLTAEHAEALLRVKEALGQLPGRLYLLKNLGVLESLNGNSAQALAYFQQVVERSPTSAEARYQLGLEYLKVADPQRAVDILQQIPPDQANPEMRSALRRAQKAAGMTPDP
jgi:O-antigen ligase